MNPREILGVRENATSREIRKAYCELALKYHPDKNPSGAPQFRAATEAYKALIEGGTGADTTTSAASSSSSWPARSTEPPRDWYPSRQDSRYASGYRRGGQEPPAPPDPSRPWSNSGGYEASTPRPYVSGSVRTPRADDGRGYGQAYPQSFQGWAVYPTYAEYPAPSSYPWNETNAEILGQMIEVLFFEEFGVRWADLPREAQEVLLRGAR